MRRDEALSHLQGLRGEFAARGIRRLSLFGSVARDEAGPGSDVDVLVEFEGRVGLAEYFGLAERLEAVLGCRVDLVMDGALKPRMRSVVEREAIRVA